jgi:uncharacterized protein with beta-barrel porin domain
MTYRKISILTILALAFVLSAYAADATGKWTAEFSTQIGQQKYTFDLKADGATLTGKATSPRGTQDIKEGKVNGDEVSFVEMLELQDQQIRIEYKGKVNGDEMKLTRKVGDFGSTEAVAKRMK